MRRNDVESTSFRLHVPTRFLINQCQIITFLILNSDNIENSRIDLKGIILPVPSNQIKLQLLLFYPSTWYICEFFLFQKLKENAGGLFVGWGGGGLAPLFLRLCNMTLKQDTMSHILVLYYLKSFSLLGGVCWKRAT